ncbi:hypothetical protein [Pseudoduganella buxea]|uniref:Uncharacterized protein n=1 Tax=Pseudoduganella buxea TaxID=1949069 RepID=A0A6I3SYE1_9BURK|nr:hypothetical protein [Pseudoduganella buxea]MTV54193.1 hypothetical protein [Pseudoduganella buxea]
MEFIEKQNSACDQTIAGATLSIKHGFILSKKQQHFLKAQIWCTGAPGRSKIAPSQGIP